MKVKVILSLIQTQLSHSSCTRVSTSTKKCASKFSAQGHWCARRRARFINTYQSFKPALLLVLVLSCMDISIHSFIQTNFNISLLNLCSAMVFSIIQGQIKTNQKITSFFL